MALEAEATNAQLLQEVCEPVRAATGDAEHAEVRSLLWRLLNVAKVGCEHRSVGRDDEIACCAVEAGDVSPVLVRTDQYAVDLTTLETSSQCLKSRIHSTALSLMLAARNSSAAT